ncbi:Rieske 2Fe-2S domain-containing protein [Allorhizobium sp. NPDC080224]|uniref:aromatic ring-hydroxylating dioxygenase subunit alpha n=1 Tax=Allorhizobium sp. NPDC080224 TaxID=3390547 RepID=UPI003D08F7D6
MSKPTFPLNAWYAAAYDVELKRQLLPRTICNKPVVLYRKENGMPVALADACWHRLVPLSLGRLEGDNVICGYHGLEFDETGRCVYMPSQDTINPSACVKSYPIAEKHRFIWIWPGDPALADPALIPDMHWNQDPDWAADGKLIEVKCDYRLVVDNLMDLTHETFVHGSSIGNRAVAEAPFEASHSDRFAYITRWMEDIDPPPFWRKQFGRPGKVDRWQIIRFEAPCTVTIDVGVAEAGTGAKQGDRSKGVNGYVLNTITPSTDKTCLYFWAFARNYDLGNQARTHELREGVAGVFREDEEVLEAQQRAIDANPDHQFYNLNIDAGSMWARKLIDRMIDAETKPQAGPHAVAAE